MNLVIDIGNSRTKFSVFNNGEEIISVPIKELHRSHIDLLFKKYPFIDKAIISSVKDYSQDIKINIQKRVKIFIELDEYTPLPIINCYKSKNTLGKDRLAAAVGAIKLYPDKNILIIDAGTALTYDLISKGKKYLGGNISLGLEMRFKALNHFTGRLPLVKKRKNFNNLFGQTTEEAILAGIQHGIAYEVDKVIDTFKENYENLYVIITGGDANFFDKRLKNSFFVHFNLIAIGLNHILEYNGEN